MRSSQTLKTQILSLVCDESKDYRAQIRKIWELEANKTFDFRNCKKSKYCKIDSLQDYTELYCQRWNDNCLTREIRKKKDYRKYCN